MNNGFKFLLLCLSPLVGMTTASATPIGPDFANVSQAVLPTTVHIHVERGPLIASGIQQMARDYALPTRRAGDDALRVSTGSGVIMNTKGLVLTNHHVVNGAHAIRVTLHDQRRFEATLVSHDPRTDVALLQIQGDGPFDAATFGDSNTLAVGQWVIAVGHPFDFPFTVTAGIVSALGRRGLGQNEIQDYIQTDVAVNPGSSGGPLFNTAGEVVGINTAIFSPDKENLANAGISFAIPSSMATRIAAELIEHGRVRYASIGVQTEDSTPSASKPHPGARVTQVIARGPGEKAGLRRGDVIIAVDGEPVPTSNALSGLILSRAVGSTLQLKLQRGKKSFLTPIKTTNSEDIESSKDTKKSATQGQKWAGITMVDATQKRLTKRGIALPSDTFGGALIVGIEPDSPAAMAGLRIGDVLLKIQDTPIPGVDGLLATVDNHSVAMLSFWRGQNFYLAVLAIGVQPR
jgi:serine protease Do